MDPFDAALTADVKSASRQLGSEWLIPDEKIDRAIGVTNAAEIAILGIEAFFDRQDGLETRDIADFSVSIKATDGWADFVRRTNDAARDWIAQHRRPEYSYVLTTTSRDEYEALSG